MQITSTVGSGTMKGIELIVYVQIRIDNMECRDITNKISNGDIRSRDLA